MHIISCIVLLSGALQAVTLSDAIEKAKQRELAIATQQKSLESLEEESTQALGTALPAVDINAQISREDIPDSEWSKGARVTAKQPLLTWLKASDLREITAAKKTSGASKLSALERQLAMKVATSYFEVLAMQSDLKLLAEVLASNQSRVRELRQRVQIGRSRAADLYAAEAQVATTESQMATAERGLTDAWRSLELLTGIQRDSAIEDTPSISPASDENWQTQHPHYLQTTADLEAANFSVSAARKDHLPRLDLMANYYLYREKPSDEVKWDVGLQFTLPIYGGGITQSRVSQANIEVQKANDARADTLRQIAFEGERLLTLRKSLDQQLRHLEKASSLLEKSTKQIIADYAVGLSTNLDVIQSQNSLTESRRQQSRQIYLQKTTTAQWNLYIRGTL